MPCRRIPRDKFSAAANSLIFTFVSGITGSDAICIRNHLEWVQTMAERCSSEMFLLRQYQNSELMKWDNAWACLPLKCAVNSFPWNSHFMCNLLCRRVTSGYCDLVVKITALLFFKVHLITVNFTIWYYNQLITSFILFIRSSLMNCVEAPFCRSAGSTCFNNNLSKQILICLDGLEICPERWEIC